MKHIIIEHGRDSHGDEVTVATRYGKLIYQLRGHFAKWNVLEDIRENVCDRCGEVHWDQGNEDFYSECIKYCYAI